MHDSNVQNTNSGSLVAWRVYSASKRTLSILKDSNLVKLKTRGMHFGETAQS